MKSQDVSPSLEEIRANPTLHPAAFALVQEHFSDLKWHSHAASPDSSQAFALSAFVPLLTIPDKDDILDRFVTQVLPFIAPRPDRRWQVVPEFVQRVLLGETGAGVPTNVDVLLIADDVVVCVESKFRVDALEGFGRCGQFMSGACLGYHGKGSDAKGKDEPCRLAVRDGRRDARLYWQLGRPFFRDSVFAEQDSAHVCPYRDTYQLMRNYLLAAEYARRNGQAMFAAIGVVPASRSAALGVGVGRFKTEMLLPERGDSVACANYEGYIEVLAGGSPEAQGLAEFLEALL